MFTFILTIVPAENCLPRFSLQSLVEFLEFLSILLTLLYERLRSNWLGFVCLGGVTRSDFDLNATFYAYFLQLALLKNFYDLCIWDSLKTFCKHVCNYQIFTICLGQSGWMNNQLIFSFQLNIHSLCQFYDYLSAVVKCVILFHAFSAPSLMRMIENIRSSGRCRMVHCKINMFIILILFNWGMQVNANYFCRQGF